MRIGIDLTGSDCSPAVLFEAVIQAVDFFPEVVPIVFITRESLDVVRGSPVLSSPQAARIQFQAVSEVIDMEDEPLLAIRKKRNSALNLGLDLLKSRYLDGFVSAGNTGALIAGATLTLALLPGVKRPALLALLPTKTGSVAIIDVGGYVSCSASHLLQFAQLGAAYQQSNQEMERPRMGLLNIGVESKKGRSEERQAYRLLREWADSACLEFVGNVEGCQVFQGIVDVLVTDGFTGNVLLKTSEGISSFMLQRFEQLLSCALPGQKELFLRELSSQFDSERYPGALICGVDGVVVKCHGQSSARGLFQGICGAVQLVRRGFIDRIRSRLASFGHPNFA